MLGGGAAVLRETVHLLGLTAIPSQFRRWTKLHQHLLLHGNHTRMGLPVDIQISDSHLHMGVAVPMPSAPPTPILFLLSLAAVMAGFAYLAAKLRCTVTAAERARFMDINELSGRIDEVPGLAPANVRRQLERHGIRTSLQLIAHFLRLERNEAQFANFLRRCGVRPADCEDVANIVAARVRLGVRLRVPLPDRITQSSRLKDDTITDFLSREFNNRLEHDFQGFGLGRPDEPLNASVRNLAAANPPIDSTNRLFAALLMRFDEPITPPSAEKDRAFRQKVQAFQQDLARMGVAVGYTATIVDALKRQLDIGIDNVGTHRRGPALLTPRTGGQPHRHQRQRPESPERPASGNSSLHGYARSVFTAGLLLIVFAWVFDRVWAWFGPSRALVLANY